MNKRRIRMICIVLLAFSLCFPMMISQIQDYYDIHKISTLDDNQTQDILKNHPIIGKIYEQFQRKDITSKRHEYVIRSKDDYSAKEQEKIVHLQSLFSKEIQELIDLNILSTTLLETDPSQPYQADYGRFITYDSEDFCSLEQILRMDDERYKSIDYDFESVTGKITSVSIRQQEFLSMTDEQLKDIAMNMIKYLELDDIDDWTYNQYGYESNKAKLRISCTMQSRFYRNELSIQVSLLGILHDYLYQSTVF